MPNLRVLLDRLRALRQSEHVHEEIDEELRFHLDMRTEENIRRGMTPADARRDAGRTFGHLGFVRELAYDVRGGGWLESAWQDLRYAVRGLRAKPAFTFGVILTLGLGIGANAAMFGIVDQLLLRAPSFLRDAAHMHRVYQMTTHQGVENSQTSTRYPRFVDLQRFTHSFTSITGFATRDVAVGDGENARERPVTAASASYFDLFEMRPALGRFFTPDEDIAPRGAPVVVLGYAYWQSEYGGRAGVLGTRVRVGRTLCTIIGVAPPGFTGVADQGVPAMYVPLTTYAWDRRGSDVAPNYDYTKNYGWLWLELVARRRADVTLASAEADLTSALRQSYLTEAAAGKEPPPAFERFRPHAGLGPLQYGRGPDAGPEAKVVLWVTGVALIVLLIACANVANLLLTRALARRREIALRLALGVSRARLARQLLTESLVLAAVGGVIGLVAAQMGGGVLRAMLLPANSPAMHVTDGRTLLFASVATLGAALLTGLAPLSQSMRYQLATALHAGGRDLGGRTSRLRTTLLLLQATLSVVLLVGAGLFVRSLQNVRAARLGFDVDPLLVVHVKLRSIVLTNGEQLDLERRLADAALATPGVVSATPSPSVPYDGFEGRGLWVPGVDSVMKLGSFFLQAGNPDYFKIYGTRIIRGRAFDDRDGPSAPRVMVVSQGMAARVWPGVDPLGHCVRVSADTMPCTTVIGVAQDMHIHSLRQAVERNAADRAPHEYTYTLPLAQYRDGPSENIVVRVAGDAADYAESVRRSLQRLMPGASYVTTVPLRRILDPKMQSWLMGATMFVAFAALALTLAGIGLYSVISYGVAQRRQEIGVRIALGASRGHVVRLVVSGGIQLVMAGVAIGTLVSLGASRWMAPLLFRESPKDPLIYAGVAAVLVVVAVVATTVPALGASRVDPNVALRAD